MFALSENNFMDRGEWEGVCEEEEERKGPLQ